MGSTDSRGQSSPDTPGAHPSCCPPRIPGLSHQAWAFVAHRISPASLGDGMKMPLASSQRGTQTPCHLRSREWAHPPHSHYAGTQPLATWAVPSAQAAVRQPSPQLAARWVRYSRVPGGARDQESGNSCRAPLHKAGTQWQALSSLGSYKHAAGTLASVVGFHEPLHALSS